MSERRIDALRRRIWRELYQVPVRLAVLRVLFQRLATPSHRNRGVAMSEIDKLVKAVARAYLAVRGNTFNHLGVQLPLDQEVLTMAIHNQIVGAHLEHAGGKQGREDTLLMLRHMVAGEAITPLGAVVLDEMNKAFCTDVRGMLDRDLNPIAEFARECERRATQ